jgi:rod shape-determining protein MreC
MPRSVREIAIVIVLIGGGLLILFSSANKAGEQGLGTRGVYRIMKPFQQAVTAVHDQIDRWRKHYITLVGVSKDNDRLKHEIRELRRERTDLLNAESENRRLKKLLDLKSRHEFPSLVAQIIGEDAVGWYRTFFINRGAEDGVLPNMPVTAAEGIVGRVSKSTPDMSQVLLITDPNFSVDCRILRTRDRGILSGSLERACVLRYVNLKSDIQPGDDVITSGLDRVFPRGLSVGKIQSLRKGPQGLFLEAAVVPSVDFAAIEEVLVVLGHGAGFDLQPGLDDKR